MVLGETEILGQLKSAYQFALGCRFTGKALNKAFQRAFQLAKESDLKQPFKKVIVSGFGGCGAG